MFAEITESHNENVQDSLVLQWAPWISLWKVSNTINIVTKWVPKHLTREMKDQRKSVYEELLQYWTGRNEFMQNIIMGEETWVTYYDNGKYYHSLLVLLLDFSSLTSHIIQWHTTSPHTTETKVTKVLKANSYRQQKWNSETAPV